MQFVLNLCAFDQFAKPRPLVAAAKSSTTEILFDKRTQICGVSAFFSRVYRFTNDGMSVISPGNKAVTKSSCTSKTAFSRSANSLASVDLPAAIFPQRKINFAEPAIWPHIIPLVTRAVDEIRSVQRTRRMDGHCARSVERGHAR